MCGIAGLWRRSRLDQRDVSRIEDMAESLVHRGPDDFGYLLADASTGRLSFGHELAVDFVPDLLLASRRLAILDLSAAGRQPIANETGDIVVVFNGAIHNYVELRLDLEAHGHTFRSHTDTEVIVHAYEEWGEDCARRFNGMWAYAIWDSRRHRLVCSRDRFGIKPLFVAWIGDTFYFASEAKAILAGGEVPARPNLAWIKRYLTFASCENGRDTAFEGITQVPPGCNVVVTRDGCHQASYWSCTDQSEDYDYDQTEETFRELFRDALKIRFRSDAPVALLLSGGLDSSSIAVLANSLGAASHMEAWTAIFPGFPGDENRHAALVAAAAGLPLHCVEYDPSRLLDDLDKLTWHLDAPPQRGQELARWQLPKAVSSKARVVLEGQGADELLAGYPDRYSESYLRAELGRLRPWNLARGVPRLIRGWRVQNRARPSSLGRFLRNRKATPPVLPTVARSLEESAWTDSRRTPEQFTDPLTRALYRDHALGLLSELLHFGDAISMAHAVESRLPFLDHRLVEFVFALPFDAKMRATKTKYIMRRAFATDLPAAILDRQDKVGFGTPLPQWLRQHTVAIHDLLGSQRARERGVFDPQGLSNCVSRFESNGASVPRIFRSIALELWFRRFID